MFGRATITLDIGPHSSFIWIYEHGFHYALCVGLSLIKNVH